ncbi:hypothetical protein [Endozoicomonas sp. Mp262]|uniref:type III secretion apparatus assembly protein SctX n=1 Tax=Endozoicomonas sp. Mp262 TaxID=2919499 RepID=UPI0021DB0353
MKISPLNRGLDQVQLGPQQAPLKEFPSQKELPPDGQAVTDHVANMYPAGRGELLLENFARPDTDDLMLHAPSISCRTFDSLMQALSQAPENSAAAAALTLLKEQQMDLAYLQANLKNLVQA